MEAILLDTMFDLPGMNGVQEVVISREVVDGEAKPLLIYADRDKQAKAAPFRPDEPLKVGPNRPGAGKRAANRRRGG